MQAFVYKSLRKPDTYLYLRERDAFGLLPEPVLAPLGQLAFVMELALSPGRKLAQVKVGVRLAQGFVDEGLHDACRRGFPIVAANPCS